MPRYFFHVQDGSDFIDEAGTELRDPTEARVQAVISASEALKEHARKFWDHGEWSMTVVDETGAPVCSLRFSAEHPAYVR